MINSNVGIDLGTSNFRINIEDKGIILDEPSVIAVRNKTNEVMGVGHEAYKMLGKAPSKVTVKYPMIDGVISDFTLNELMIKEFFKKANVNTLVKPQFVISIHTDATDLERRSVVEAAISVGARKVYLVEEPILSALGSGTDISKPSGIMVMNIGGGTIDCAILSMNGIVKSCSKKVGGRFIDSQIIKKILLDDKITIGEHMAEEVKLKLGTAFTPNQTKKDIIKGRSLINGLPCKRDISQSEIHEVIKFLLKSIIYLIKELLEDAPPELVGDINTNGIILTGGGAHLRGLKEYIERMTNIKTIVASNPSDCVAYGTGIAIELKDKLVEWVNQSGYKK